jgi:hypothetical protein
MLIAVSVNTLPEVTAWLAVSAPVAISVFEPLVSAQCVAVPLAVTAPSVIAGTTTRRPSTVPSEGPVQVRPVLLPRLLVEVAWVYVVGSDEQISRRVPLVIT